MADLVPVDHDSLTQDEVNFLRGASCVPAEIRDYVTRQHETIGVRSRAYRKVLMAARAEAEAILAVRVVKELRGEAATIESLRNRLSAATRERDELRVAIEGTRKRAVTDAARPALAVHSGRD